MPKVKKEKPDEVDFEILSALYYLKQATATDLEKEIKLSRATISDRLKWLVEHGYLDEPINDISTGKLKRIYRSPDPEKLKKEIWEYYNEIAYKKDIDSDLETIFIEDLSDELSGKDFRRMREGVSLREALRLLKSYVMLFIHDQIIKTIEVNGDQVKLTQKGINAILEDWLETVREWLAELKAFDENIYKDFLSEYCKEIRS